VQLSILSVVDDCLLRPVPTASSPSGSGPKPLRYHTQLRLLGGHRLTIAVQAARVGFYVSYNNPSQFNRECASFC
jgi:hypothetical protein